MTNNPQWWTVFREPCDRPGAIYFARRTEFRPDLSKIITTRDTCEASTLDELRALLPNGLIRMPRAPMDDPDIVELWF
jgi:hypothetical protein